MADTEVVVINTNRIRAVTTLGTLIACGIVSVGGSVTLHINAQNKEGIELTTDGSIKDVAVVDNVLVYNTESNITDNFKYNVGSINDNMELIEREGIVVEPRQMDETMVENNVMHECIALASDNGDVGMSEEELVESNNKLLEDLEIGQGEEKKSVETVETVMITVEQSDALLEIDQPDSNYTGTIVTLSEEDRWVLEHLVMGEAGNQGFEGAALVAQCIRDSMVYGGIQTVEEVRVLKKYSGKLNLDPNEDVLRAVEYIFDQGGIAVKHKIEYFYAPKRCEGAWHEKQQFIIEYGGHKFFDAKK